MLSLLALIACALPQERWPRPDVRVECGPLVLEVHVSRTAHAFHLVDQVSAWDNACHGQYRRALEAAGELDDADEAVLAEYVGVRREKRWGQGLEQTFYTPLDLDDALRAGLKAKRLTREQAEICERALRHFAERADRLLEERREVLTGAFEGLDRATLTRAAEQLSRFTGVRRLVLPTFPVASPDGGGGGMDGGRLRWEISDRIEPSVLLHEATHGFLMERDELVRELVDSVPGLSMTLAGEGFAYAVAPGMYPFRDGDVLAHNVAQDRCGADRWDGRVGYGMQRMFGLAVRPLLADAFERGQSLEEFLPRLRDAYLAVDEVMMAAELRPPTLFMAGQGRDVVRERMGSSKYHLSMARFNLAHAGGFADARERAQPGDLLVILVSGEDAETVPAEHRDLLPVELATVRERLTAGREIEAEGTAGPLRVVLLAAPTTARLEKLARTSALVHD